MKNQTEVINPESFNGLVKDYMETANDFIKYETSFLRSDNYSQHVWSQIE